MRKFIFSKFAGLQAYSRQLYYQINSFTGIFWQHFKPPMLPTCFGLSPLPPFYSLRYIGDQNRKITKRFFLTSCVETQIKAIIERKYWSNLSSLNSEYLTEYFLDIINTIADFTKAFRIPSEAQWKHTWKPWYSL